MIGEEERRRFKEIHTEEEGHVTRGRKLQRCSCKPKDSKHCQEPPEAGKRQRIPPQSPQGEHGPADPLVWGFWLPEGTRQ